jgi:hypothetical protein
MDPLSACLLLAVCLAPADGASLLLRAPSGVEAVFTWQGGQVRWSGYRDLPAGQEWPVTGPLFSLETPDGTRVNLSDVGYQLEATQADEVALVCEVPDPHVEVHQTYSFCADERTLRVRTRLRSLEGPVTIRRVGLLEIRLPGQALRLAGASTVSSPVVGERVFAGVEHPSALCQVEGDALWLAQHPYLHLSGAWADLPSVVLGSASAADVAAGPDPVKRAFLRYLDTVRVKPRDMHIHYNNWWTMPVPFTEDDVLGNIADLRKGLYDGTGFFFDSYAMDMGWSDPHSVWEVNRRGYPEGLSRIRDALAAMGCRPGLWVSPSSVYPPESSLDNAWLASAGYEVSPGAYHGSACLALGGRYQQALKAALLAHVRQAHLAHVKFDGLVQTCDVASHGHPTGVESYLPIAEGLADILDALRKENPDIALEPTCLGYSPSPWWLMHTPFVIGPFGDDSPRGVCASPEWSESLTTGRDLANIRGQDAFWMPSDALECFDTVVQCPGDFANHGVMAVARGHWFQSTYINPRYMDADEWRFFADLMRWARANRYTLRQPTIIGGDPAERKPYGYAYLGEGRQLLFVRNPWIEETRIALPLPAVDSVREIECLYPVRETMASIAAGEASPEAALGPYETLVLEVVPADAVYPAPERPDPGVTWVPDGAARFERVTYEPEPPAYGPDWTSPQGDASEVLSWTAAGELRTASPAELCVLVEGPPDGQPATASATLDGAPLPLREAGSRGAFSATGAGAREDWQWFLASVGPGAHRLSVEASVPSGEVCIGLFVRGKEPREANPTAAQPTPAFPLPPRPGRSWSRTLAPLATVAELGATERRAAREIVRIDGVYVDSLEWTEATAGWGQVRRNASIMERPMTLGGRIYRRGIGAHAVSRVAYDLPDGYARFAATVGCDQEVQGNSVVFVVEADGVELYRSPLMRKDTEPIDLDIPIAGARQLALVLEDGGDGIGADHGDWAEARLLR